MPPIAKALTEHNIRISMSLNSEQARKKAIEGEIEEHNKQSDPTTYRIEFRGQNKNLPVVRMNTEYLLLNPQNNRLSAQLIDHPKRFQIESDPTGTTSQSILAELLEQTVEFTNLEQQLKEMGQKEPGLITREGVLVNGNTRVVALRKLGVTYVEVAVLPDNVTDTDILDLEMTLQLTQLVHQDYSFTNELLLMNRFLSNGGTEKDLAKKMAWLRRGVSKVQLHMRMLHYIEDVRGVCNSPLLYAVFDSKAQHLKDLDDAYQSLKNSGDIAAAESLKWTRLSGIFLGLNKDHVRTISAEFVDEHLIPRIGDQQDEVNELFVPLHSEPSNDDLDDLFSTDESTEYFDMKLFLTGMLNDDNNRDESGNTEKDLSGIYNKISFYARRSAEKIIDEQKLESANADPSEVLKEMRAKLSTLLQNLPSVTTSQDFKVDKFKYDFFKLKNEVAKIELFLNELYSGSK